MHTLPVVIPLKAASFLDMRSGEATLKMRIRWTFVQDFCAWAFGFYLTWTLVAAAGAHFLSCYLSKDMDARADIWGTTLQLFGIYTIAHGLNAKLREHTGSGLMKTLRASVRDALSTMPTPLSRSRTITGTMAGGELSLDGSRAHATVGPAPDATLEQRLHALETNYRVLSAAHFNLETTVIEQDRRHQRLLQSIETQSISLIDRIREASVGGYATEVIGAALLWVGVWYGTMPIWTPMACPAG